MQAPEAASFISIVDGSLNPVPLCDLDQVLLKKVMAENRGFTLFDLKKRPPEAGPDPCGHLWVTWGVYLCASKPPLADIILPHRPDLT